MAPVKAWKKAALALAGVAYVRAMVKRNERLRPPPVRDLAGRPLPHRTLEVSDGERIDYLDAGEGTPILWVPGADGVKETWRYQLPLFADRHRVLAPDLRRRFAVHDEFDRFAEDLVELVDATGAGPVVLVGQSLGGAIGIHFAYRFPRLVRCLVLCNTLTRVSYGHVGLNRTALVPLAMATTRYLPTPLAAAAARAWNRLAVWIYDPSPGGENLVDYALWSGPRTASPAVSGARVDLLRELDLRPELGAIRAPTLVVKGPLDRYCPPEWALEIAAGIPGARYALVPGTGHCSHISRPGVFNAIVLGFLEECLSGAGPSETEGERRSGAGGG